MTPGSGCRIPQLLCCSSLNWNYNPDSSRACLPHPLASTPEYCSMKGQMDKYRNFSIT